MFDQHIRKPAFDLPRLHLIVELGNFGQSTGGNQPDLAGTRIRNPHQVQVRLDVARRHGAEFLRIQRNAFLGNSVGLREVIEPADKGTVQHHFELGSHLLAFGLAACRTHLQILRSNAVVPGLRRLQKTKHGPRRRRASQRIGRSINHGRGG